MIYTIKLIHSLFIHRTKYEGKCHIHSEYLLFHITFIIVHNGCVTSDSSKDNENNVGHHWWHNFLTSLYFYSEWKQLLPDYTCANIFHWRTIYTLVHRSVGISEKFPQPLVKNFQNQLLCYSGAAPGFYKWRTHRFNLGLVRCSYCTTVLVSNIMENDCTDWPRERLLNLIKTQTKCK